MCEIGELFASMVGPVLFVVNSRTRCDLALRPYLLIPPPRDTYRMTHLSMEKIAKLKLYRYDV